jgi:hypothetical protein
VVPTVAKKYAKFGPEVKFMVVEGMKIRPAGTTKYFKELVVWFLVVDHFIWRLVM